MSYLLRWQPCAIYRKDISNHWQPCCKFNRLFKLTTKKHQSCASFPANIIRNKYVFITSKRCFDVIYITYLLRSLFAGLALCDGNHRRASNAENVSMSWRFMCWGPRVREVHVPSQGSRLHGSSSRAGPGHIPPHCGTGSSQRRVRFREPSSHVTEHSDHSLHLPQPPSPRRNRKSDLVGFEGLINFYYDY